MSHSRPLYSIQGGRKRNGHSHWGRKKLTLSLVSRSFLTSVCQPPSVLGVQRRSVIENSSNSVKSLSVHCSLTDNLLSPFCVCVCVCVHMYMKHTLSTATIHYWWHPQKPTPAGYSAFNSAKSKIILSLQFSGLIYVCVCVMLLDF